MKSISVSFIKTHDDAVLPKRNHGNTNDYTENGDSGYDLTSVERIIIKAGESVVVPVGLKLGYITPGYWCRIESRSGNAFKYGLECFNGIIDNSYRGDLSVLIFNRSKKDHVVEKGDRIAQLVFYPIVSIVTTEMDEPSKSERAEKGFGSSGD